MTPPLRGSRQGEDGVRSRAGGGSFYFRSIPLTASAFAQKTLGFCDSPSRGESCLLPPQSAPYAESRNHNFFNSPPKGGSRTSPCKKGGSQKCDPRPRVREMAFFSFRRRLVTTDRLARTDEGGYFPAFHYVFDRAGFHRVRRRKERGLFDALPLRAERAHDFAAFEDTHDAGMALSDEAALNVVIASGRLFPEYAAVERDVLPRRDTPAI